MATVSCWLRHTACNSSALNKGASSCVPAQLMHQHAGQLINNNQFPAVTTTAIHMSCAVARGKPVFKPSAHADAQRLLICPQRQKLHQSLALACV